MKIQFSPEIKKAREAYLAVRKAAALQIDSAHQEWNDLSVKQTDAAITKEEAMLAFKAAPWGMSAKMYALEKLAAVCETKKDLLEVYEKSSGRRLRNDKHPALLKFQAIIRLEIDSVTSIDEAAAVYWSALEAVGSSYGASGVHKEAFEKLLSLCTTVEMLEGLRHRMSGMFHSDNHWMYVKRMEEITGEKRIQHNSSYHFF
jgi:hypothetical protein